MAPEVRFCTRCGHQLGVGRYCTSCGAPVVPQAAAPRQAVQPPPAASVPPAPRFPLYADTVVSPGGSEPPPSAPPPSAGNESPAGRPSRGWLRWVAAAVLLVVAVVSAVLLVVADDDEPADRDRAGAGGGSPRGDRGAADVGLAAEVEVPATAPASADNDGNPVTFVADNMLDGDPRTCWRMAGDGTGAVLTFTFDEPVEITSVGLVNGYAKTDPPDDWYAANRRVLAVTWSFDDGTEVTQDLTETREIQTVEVDTVETSSVELRIDAVSAPGSGASGRDFTAISGVALAGSDG